ncbi:HDIG domain-containing protein [Lachnospiraceae bacterium G41]|nr:HDIG domain-containing protein [Lachnospiraceae bacterium G41]
MQEVFRLSDIVLASCVDIFLFVIMFLSLKKCFIKEERRKIGSFFLTLVLFPVQWFFVSMLCSLTFVGLFFYQEENQEALLQNRLYLLIGTGVCSILFFLILFVCVLIGIKWLRLKKVAPFIFLYTMFLTIYISTTFYSFGYGTLYSIPHLGGILSLLGKILSAVIIWCFYRLIVLKFSELITDNSNINWKLFIIPPLLFSIFYSFFGFLIITDSMNEDILVFGSIFSFIAVALLIWAFYVILKNMAAANEIKTLSVEVMEALAHTIDAKDEYTKGHSVRVAKYSRMLAEKLGLNEGDCESVYYMALLHDIGKIGVPNEIINSKSKMTDEEYAIMKTHPGIGSDILEEIKSRPDLMIGARWHHERYDGKGYPDQKAGEDIPYFARIISVADSYDAMTSNRSYRKFLPQDVVRGEIEKNSGTQFDPNVAKCMLSIIDEDVNYEYHE